VIVGQYAGDVAINPHWQINKKHVDIRGTWGVDYSHFYRTVQLMSKHQDRFMWRDLITQVHDLNTVQQALEDVEALRVFKAVIAPN